MWGKKNKISEMSAESTPTGDGKDDLAHGSVKIKKRSRVPGVMITQYVEQLPPGTTTPDFTRKPIAVTIQEGKTASFKALVTGEPAPAITWARNKGDTSDPVKYKTRYDEKSGEYILELMNVTADQGDTYKCFATNPFGRAVCTATLKVIEVGFKKNKSVSQQNDPEDFRKMLKKSVVVKKRKEKPKKEGDIDPKFWEVLLSAQKKDYERICREYGVTDYRWMLKRLNQMKKERDEEQAKYVEKLETMKQIEVKTSGNAEFELNMKLKDPNNKIYLYKDGEMISYGDGTDDSFKHNMKKDGDKYTFSITNAGPEDGGLYQVDVEDVNLFSTGLEVPDVEFASLLRDVKVVEGQDATFECVLSGPVKKISWCASDVPIEHGDKYNITASEDMLTHRLVVKNCTSEEKGVYTAIVGTKLSKAGHYVKDSPNAQNKGKNIADCVDRLIKEQISVQQKGDRTTSRAEDKKKPASTTVRETGGTGTSLRDVPGEDGIGRDESGSEGKGKDDSVRGGVGKDGLGKDGLSRAGMDKDGFGVTGQKRDRRCRDGAGGISSGINGVGGTLSSGGVKGGTISGGDGADGSMSGGDGVDGNRSGGDGLGGNRSGGDGADGNRTGGDEADGNISGGDGVGGNRSGGDVADENRTGGDEAGGNKSDGTGHTKHKKRIRDGSLVPDTIVEPGVQFLCGLSDTTANVGEIAEFSCTLSSEDCVGIWYKDGKKLESRDGITIDKYGAVSKLLIKNCHEGDAGTYRFQADGHKSEATLSVKDPPKISADALSKFSEPIIVKAGENAVFKLPFSGKELLKVQWFRDDEELLEDPNVKIECSSTESQLLLKKCQRKDTGEVKIKIRNEYAAVEAISRLIVLDKPTQPQGPVDVVESSLSAIELKWRPPKDNGGCPVINYFLERQQLGRNTWTKIGEIPEQPTYRDTNVDRGRKYCYRIRAKNSEGMSDMMVTGDIAAGMLAFPGQPASPKVTSTFKDCINLAWLPPTSTGGGSLMGYNLEKRKKGSNLWSQVNPLNEPITEKRFAVKDVMEGAEYEFRVIAINACGPGEPSGPSDCVFARDPQKPPGKVIDLKVYESSYTSLSLAWTKPTVVKGEEDEAKGYFVEIRPMDQIEWSRCNTNPIIQTSFTVTGLKSLAMYWVRVIATNKGGDGLPQGFDNYIIAMPPPVKPKFTDSKMTSFMVVRAGNTVRVNIHFEASPLPDITWLKDSVGVAKHVTVTNSEKVSQLLIPRAKRSDSGIYTITVKNMVGQDIFNVEIRVTDEPKPPGPVELVQNVQGTVTLTWMPSPDEKRDDRLHYVVMQRDSVKCAWQTVADNLFNHKFTIMNIMEGREYSFHVFAKNEMGLSEPSKSPTWGTIKKKVKFIVNSQESKNLDFQSAPKFTVPLKMHTASKGYECYMSCAVRGSPSPHITWYHNNVSLNANTNYYISNTCGVCSMLILRVGPKDTGEYKVVAENSLGQAECSTNLTIRE